MEEEAEAVVVGGEAEEAVEVMESKRSRIMKMEKMIRLKIKLLMYMLRHLLPQRQVRLPWSTLNLGQN